MKGKCPFCGKMIVVGQFNPDTYYKCPHCYEKLWRIKPILNSKEELIIVKSFPDEPANDELPPVKQMTVVRQDSGSDYLIDFVAVELKKDINYLIRLGIKLDKGTLAGKTGGVAWAGYEAFTGNWLSALVIGGISMLAGGLTKGYKQIKLKEMQQKWRDKLSALSQEQLEYLATGLQRKYPLLLVSFQNLLKSGQE